MGIDTDLNINPFFDDFDELKNYHRILFRPTTAVQARELTQLQTIQQNQIERLGQHLFQEGTILNGCTLSFDNQYYYAKLIDLQADGQPVNVGMYANTYARNSANLTALVVDVQSGFQSQNPDLNTIFIKYINSGVNGEKAFANDQLLTFYGKYPNNAIDTSTTIAQVRVANGSFIAPTGNGYAVSVSDGIIFQKGHLIRVDKQTAVVEKYSSTPSNKVVGFVTQESIVNNNVDTSLSDNALGFSNENAPGAYRLKLYPTLQVYSTNATPNGFFSIVEFQGGNPIKQKQTTEYNKIGRELATRTQEESGDYVVRPFALSSRSITSNTTHFNLVVQPGLAYVDGYRVEIFNNLSVPVRKGTDALEKVNQTVSTNYGSYVLLNEFIGTFDFNQGATVSLRDTAGTRITSGSLALTGPGAEIGTARIRSLVYDNGIPGTPTAVYRLYLFDIKMNAGFSFNQVKSIFYNGTNKGIGDVVQEGGLSYTYETDFNPLVFSFGQKAIKRLRNASGVNNTTFVYRTQDSALSFNSSGVCTITLPSGSFFPYTAGSALNDTQERDIVIVPTVTVNAANAAGSIAVTAGSNVVTGTSTSFVSAFRVGQWINVRSTNETRRITSIANNTYLTVDRNIVTANASSNVCVQYPAYVPIISTTTSATMSLDVTGQVLTINLNRTLASSMNAIISYNVQRTPGLQVNKDVLKNQYVKIDCSNNVGGVAGPWSLGVSDAFELVGVYRSNTYVESVGTDVTTNFVLETNQQESFYGLSRLRLKPTSSLALANTDKLLVKFNVFRRNETGGGRGFYSIDSYPIDDVTPVTPADKIRTEQIPIYTTQTGATFDLRNCVDFRPNAANTAAYSNTAVSATINPAVTESFDSSDRFFPAPNAVLQTDLEYYTGRFDRVIMDSYGTVKVIEGTPSENAIPPGTVNRTMSLGVVKVPPYPSLTVSDAASTLRPDYTVSFRPSQNRRYTMKEIGDLDSRISRIEYYTALTLLEKETSDLVIPSSANGSLNRFKNGIIVDPFSDLNIGNVLDGEFKAGIDPVNSELVPRFKQTKIDLKIGNTNNVAVTGDLATLGYSDVTFVTQPYATKFRNCAEGFYNFKGQISLTPAYDNYYDTRVSPRSVAIDTASSSLSLLDSLNQILPLNTSSTSTTETTDTRLISSDNFNETYETIRQSIVNTTTRQLAASTSRDVTQVGEFVTDVRFQPYIRQQTITVSATGLKPLTRVYVFFDKINLTANASQNSNVLNPVLTTDDTGSITFSLNIPGGTFFCGDREVLIADVDTYGSISASSTTASAVFSAYNYSVSKDNVSISTRKAEFNVTTNLSTTVTSERTSFTRAIPQPPPPPPPPLTFPAVDWAFLQTLNFVGARVDPISQTFFVDPNLCGSREGLFVTKIDLFFKRKSPTFGFVFQIRTTQNGYPTTTAVPFSTVRVPASAVNVSDNGASPTTITLPSPVFLKSGEDYCFVIIPEGNNSDYLIWCAEIGGTDLVTGSAVTKDWGEGVMFLSHNNVTWNAIQNEDLKFKLYRAGFGYSTGTVELVNRDYEFITANTISSSFSQGEMVTQLTTNLSGTVSVNTSSNVVIGSGTSFTTNYTVGGYITAISGANVDIRQITSIANNTYLTVNGVFKFTNTSAVYQHNVVGIVDYFDRNQGELNIKDVTTSNNTFKINVGNTIVGVISGANCVVQSVNNKKVSYYQPLLYKVNVQGTNITFATSLTSNTFTTVTNTVSPGSTNYPSVEAIVMSRTNEFASLSGNKSFKMTGTLTSDTNIISPVLDRGITGLVFYENIINNDSTNEAYANGAALCKYVSKTVNLADGQESEDFRAYVTAYRPLNTNVDVYVKVISEFDPDSIKNKRWTKLDLVSPTNLYSDTVNRQSFVELEYTLPARPPATLLAGVVNITNGTANVIGTNTTFTSSITTNDLVLIETSGAYQVAPVSAIANDNHITLNTNISIGTTPANIYKVDVKGTAFKNPQNLNIARYYDNQNVAYDGYKSFIVKIVMTSTSTHVVPRLSDFRAIALSV